MDIKTVKKRFSDKWYKFIYSSESVEDTDNQSLEFLGDMISVFKQMNRKDLVKKTAIMLQEEAARIANENN